MSSVFVLNCGSSSIKFQVVDPKSTEVLFSGIAENMQTKRCVLNWNVKSRKDRKSLLHSDYQEVIQEIVNIFKQYPVLEKRLIAVGHRIVHGGKELVESIIVNDEVMSQIYKHRHLAPLHNPVNISGIVAMRTVYPQLPQIAVFDTAFHQTVPKHAYLYAIPYTYYEHHQVRRYGFHGISHRYMTQSVAQALGKKITEVSIISAHLGNGCSVCAISNGQSVDISMGFTPLEGLMMGKRSGDIDPAVVGFLVKKLRVRTSDIITMLNDASGLLGVSGISEDLRLVQEAAEDGNQRAVLAIEMFCYRLAKYVASYLVPLGLPDALVFTGGIGENASFIRSRVIKWLSPMGFMIEEQLNQQSVTCISPKGKTPRVFVFPTHEELMIAQDALALVERA